MPPEHKFDDDVGKNKICASCIGEPFLKKLIAVEGASDMCDYCEETDKTVSLSTFADWVEGAFERHFTRTAEEPSDWEVACRIEWEREGTPAVQLIIDEAIVSESVAEDACVILAARHGDFEYGSETEFDENAHYDEADMDTGRYDDMWQAFKESLLTRSRFFNHSAESILGEIFGGIDYTSPAIVVAGPETQLTAIYRARTCEKRKDLRELIESPECQLGSRLPGDCPSGRMNPFGVSMFYGAKGVQTAVNEVRPPVGSNVVVGRFEIIRPLRLLDLGKLKRLEDLTPKGSIFDSEYQKHLERLAFLKVVSYEFSIPVMPSMTEQSYLPTQAVADFLSSRESLSLDGLIFGSSQSKEAGENVVLFTRAARVQPSQYDSTVKCEFHERKLYPDGGEMDAYVSVDLGGVQKMHGAAGISEERQSDEDYRTPALRLDLNSLEIHKVLAFEIPTESHSVDWFENFSKPVEAEPVTGNDMF